MMRLWEHLDKSLIQVNTEIKDLTIPPEEVAINLDPGIQTPEDFAAVEVLPPSFLSKEN